MNAFTFARFVSLLIVNFCFIVSIYADTVFTAVSNAAQKNPSNNSVAKGEGSVVLNAAETQITVTLNFPSLNAAQIAAHIHKGESGAIEFELPNNSFSQTLPVTPVQVADLKAGLWYFDVHSDAFADGEIRGQIKPLCSPQFVGASNNANSNVCVAGAFLTSGATNGKIAFSASRNGNYEIYTMNADGTNQTNISNNAGYDSQPAWSPEGDKIVFASFRNGNTDIYVMNADGSNQTRLTTDYYNDDQPDWSPDGTKIAFRSNRTGKFGVYTMKIDGSNQTRLTNDAVLGGAPKFSPDGSKIVFNGDRYGNDDIYAMNVDGSNQIRLTDSLANDDFPAFSPDGSKIAFHSTRAGRSNIFLMNVDGSNQIQLTNNSAFNVYPVWSPDNVKIVFQDMFSAIYTMNSDGSNQIRLDSNPFFDQYPAWQRIAFAPASNVLVTPARNLKVTFSNVSESGYTVATPLSNRQIPILPVNYGLRSNFAFDIRTSAQYSGNNNVQFNVPEVFDQRTCSRLRVLHFVNGAWEGNNNQTPVYYSGVCTLQQTADSLSLFVVAEQISAPQGKIVSGKIVYGATPAGQNAKFVSGASLAAAGSVSQTVHSDSFGDYQLNDLNSSEDYVFEAVKNGDINGITAFDATLILRCIAAGNACVLSDNQKIAADVNDNGLITPFDATLILRFVAAGTQTENAAKIGNWKFLPAQKFYDAHLISLSGENYTAVLVGEVSGNWAPPETSTERIERRDGWKLK